MRTTRVRAHHRRGGVQVRSHNRALNYREATEVQTLIFPRGQFTRVQAIDWARSHKKRHDKVDETGESFRLRQKPPSAFRRGSLRTIFLGSSGVMAVIGHPKDGHESNRVSGSGYYLVDRVTRTVQRASETSRESPPRFVKVYADSPTSAVRMAIAAAPRNANRARGGASSLEVDTVTGPAAWASALVNGDESGLEADEIEWLNRWVENLSKEGWYVVSTVDDEEPRFTNSFNLYSGGMKQGGHLITGGDVIDYVVHRQRGTAANRAGRSRYPGLRREFQGELGERQKRARANFEESLMSLGGLSAAEASRTFETYKNLKIIKFDPVNARYSVKHGRFLDRDVIRRAAHEGG